MIIIKRQGDCVRKLEHHINGKSRRVLSNSILLPFSLRLFYYNHIQERLGGVIVSQFGKINSLGKSAFLVYTIERRCA